MITDQIRKEITEKFEQVLCIGDIMDELLNAVTETFTPGELFDEEVLDTWATEHGYSKGEA